MPKQRGIFAVVSTPHSMVTTLDIVGRIIEHRLMWVAHPTLSLRQLEERRTDSIAIAEVRVWRMG